MTKSKSKKPKKQRKHIAELKLHERKQVLSSHLSKELRKETGKRALPVRKNDKVKVLRGQFKGTIGKIARTDTYKKSIFVEDIKRKKTSGTEIMVPLKASNVMIVELNRDDTRRIKVKAGVKKRIE